MTHSFVQVPPDSTGKKLHTQQHVVAANTVQVPANHLVSGDNPENILSIDSRGAAQVRFTEGQGLLTSYGSLKIESERQIGVYDPSIDSYDSLFSIETSVGGSSTYDPVKSSTVLSVNSTSGSSVKRTTNRYHYYLVGSSNLARLSIACGDAGKTGNKRRWGVYDDNDGIFFELNGTEVRVVIRSSTGGVVVEIPVPRSSWTDKLDGTGLSGFNLDVTKVNNYWADYSFSGAGRVRFGVYAPDGTRLVADTIETGNTSPYPMIRTGTLPFRTENLNTAATGSGSELREVVMSISTEGNPSDYTYWRSSDLGITDTAVTTDTHLLSVHSISLINGKHNPVQAYPETLSVISTGGAVAISFWEDVSLTSPVWNVGLGQSTLEGSTSGTLNLTNARKVLTFFVAEGVQNIDLSPYFEVIDEAIYCSANGTSKIWAFTATKLSGTSAAVGINLAYRELW